MPIGAHSDLLVLSKSFTFPNEADHRRGGFVYERCLNEAERILASDKDIIVPVKKVWTEVEKEGKRQGFEAPSLVDFTAMLEGDPRFEFIASHRSVTEDLEDEQTGEDPTQKAEMEQLGFFSGDRVKLRKVALTPTMLGEIIRTKVDRTMDALTKAWDARPDGDQDTEDKLLEILSKTQKLQREVKKTFSNDRMKRLETGLTKKTQRRGRSRKPSGRKRTAAARRPARVSAKSSPRPKRKK